MKLAPVNSNVIFTMNMKTVFIILFFALVSLIAPQIAVSQSDGIKTLQSRVSQLERRQNKQQTKIEQIEDIAKNGAPLAFLFAVFCALWAQNTGRNSWLWFFLGLFFSLVTVLFVLAKNDGGRNITDRSSTLLRGRTR